MHHQSAAGNFKSSTGVNGQLTDFRKNEKLRAKRLDWFKVLKIRGESYKISNLPLQTFLTGCTQ